MTETRDDSPWAILAHGAGEWAGEEKHEPSPMVPDGMVATGHTSARLVLDGRGLATDYAQTFGDEVTFRAHTLIRYRESDHDFVMHFHAAGGDEQVFHGAREDDALMFTNREGTMRLRLHYGDELFSVVTDMRTVGQAEWTTVTRSEYTRRAPMPGPGGIAWHDLTVDDADAVRDFYAAVVGWQPKGLSMGDYEDYEMRLPDDGECVAGVCHARGENADLPPQWLVYVMVGDLDASLEAAGEHGGRIVSPARGLMGGRMAVVADPAGAVMALYQD